MNGHLHLDFSQIETIPALVKQIRADAGRRLQRLLCILRLPYT